MATAQLTTLTPVHVGSGTTYQKDIHFLHEGKRIGIIDPEKIAERITVDEALIEAWVKAIENRESLTKFLQSSRGINLTPEEVCSSLMEVKGVSAAPTELKEHYRTPLKGICIPGSSLKGSLRTMLLVYMADEDFLDNFPIARIAFEKINEKNRGSFRDNRERDFIWNDKNVLKEVFGEDAKEQSTRFLKVGDVHFTGSDSEVREARILNLVSDKKFAFKPGSHLFEVIPQNQKSEPFSIRVDDTLLGLNKEKFPEKWHLAKVSFLKDGIAGVLKHADEMTRDVLKWDISQLEKSKFHNNPTGEKYIEMCETILSTPQSDNEFIVRVGGHSGWIFTTGAWIRSHPAMMNEEDSTYELNLKKKIQKNRHYPFDLWPKTRKVSTLGEPFGFVKIKLL